MKFGKLMKATVDSRMPQWRNYVLQYKQLKVFIKQAQQLKQVGAGSSERILSEFTNLLDVEVARVNDFYSDRIEEGVIILHALRAQAEKFDAKSFGYDKTRHACLQSLVTFHLNLLILQNYVALNFTAIAKILKKFDKKLGLCLRADYISAIVELPFYRCQVLGSLVEEAEALFKAMETPASDVAVQQQQFQQHAFQQPQSQQQQRQQQMQQVHAQQFGMPQKVHPQWQWQQQQGQHPQVAIS